jgi:hypothetical protein
MFYYLYNIIVLKHTSKQNNHQGLLGALILIDVNESGG